MSEIQKLIHYHQQKEFKDLKPKIMKKIEGLKVYESQKAEIFHDLERHEEEKNALAEDYKVTQKEVKEKKEAEKMVSEEIDNELTDMHKEMRFYEELKHDVEEEMNGVKVAMRSIGDKKNLELNELKDIIKKLELEVIGTILTIKVSIRR
jgi:hypothetical protein